MEDVASRVVKGYKLLERIGTGGYGAVYRAYQPSVQREVAVKIILPHFAAHPDFIRVFQNEAGIIARLEHPHIIPLYDFWRDVDGAFLVMRFVKGGSLDHVLRDGPFDIPHTVSFLDQVCSALDFAHRHDVIHRDLRSSNILLDEDGNAYISDFGIAKNLGYQPLKEPLDEQLETPEHLSPEEIRGELITPLTDIYSLGVLLYQVLTSQHPFSKSSRVDHLYKHLNEPLPPIKTLSPSVSDAVNTVIRKATAKKPDQRYADVLAIAADFREAVGLRPNEPIDDVVETLTPREQQALRLLADGLSNAEIAKEMVIQRDSVRWYLKQIYAKLHVSSRVQAVVRAKKLELLSSPAEPPAQPLSVTTPQVALKNPYKGLLAFQAADQANFFGREALIDKLLNRLGKSTEFVRFLAVIGPSGSGKSSLLKAGLVVKLLQGALPNSERWFIAEMVPGEHPIDTLVTVLSRLAPSWSHELHGQLAHDPQGLLRVTQCILPNDGSQLVLVVDQFEEIFTLTRDERERAHFLNLIYETVTSVRSRVYVIIALRADFYDRPLLYADFGELVHKRMETILPLSADGLERAIVEPAKRLGVTFEPGLVATIIADMNYQPGALPLLQYALAELFDRRVDHVITHVTYLAIGGAVGALARRADETYITEFDPVSQQAAQQMFLRLVTLGEGTEDTRRRVPYADLLTITADPSTMEEVIDLFAQVRLLSLDHDAVTRRPTVELAHEAILREWQRLCTWLDDNRHDIRMERLLAAATNDWLQAKRDNAFVLRGNRLDQFQTWATETHIALSATEREFLDASLVERENHIRVEREREAHELSLARQAAESAQQTVIAQRQAADRLRYLVAVLCLSLLVAILLSLMALSNRNEAQSQAKIALARQLAAQAVNELQKPLGNDEFAALLALYSLRLQYDPVADEALTRAVDRLPLKSFLGHTDEIYDVAVSPDSRMILTASADHTVRLWEVATSREIQRFEHRGEVLSAIFSPNGEYILTGGEDGQIRLWDTVTGQLVRVLSGHTAKVYCLAFSPDGSLILSGGDNDDNTLRLWKTNTGQQLRLLATYKNRVKGVAFSHDGKLALSSSDIVTQLWDVADGKLIHTFSGHSENVYSVAFSPDDSLIVTGSADNTAKLWDTTTGQLIRTFSGHSNSVRSVVFSPDGHYVLTGSGDHTARLWDTATGQQLVILRGHTDRIWSVDFAPNGKFIITAGIDRTAKLWDLSLSHSPLFTGHRDEVHGIAVSPSGQYLLTTSADQTAILWDITTHQPIRTFTAYDSLIWSAIFSPDGKNIALVGRDPNVMLFDVSTGQLVRKFTGHTSDVFSVAFSPNGKYLLTGGNDIMRLWDLATGQPLLSFNSPSVNLNVTFSPDSKYILVGNNNNTAQLWDMDTGKLARTLTLNSTSNAIWGVAFSPDGKTILTGGTEQTAILWDVATGQQLRTFSGHSNTIYSVAFAPDGKTVLTGSADHTAIVWDVNTGKPVRILSGHANAVWSVVYSPDSKFVFTGSFDGTARLWDVNYHDFLTTTCTRLLRDFTASERAEAHIPDQEPTCP